MSDDNLRAAVEALAEQWEGCAFYDVAAMQLRNSFTRDLRALLAEHPAPERPAACEICLRVGCRGGCQHPAPEPPRQDALSDEFVARTFDTEPPDGECGSCGESPEGECPKSLRPCGHHCNHVWTHDACDWCGKEFGVEPPSECGDWPAPCNHDPAHERQDLAPEPPEVTADELVEVLWESVDGKGIRGRLFRDDCAYLVAAILARYDVRERP